MLFRKTTTLWWYYVLHTLISLYPLTWYPKLTHLPKLMVSPKYITSVNSLILHPFLLEVRTPSNKMLMYRFMPPSLFMISILLVPEILIQLPQRVPLFIPLSGVLLVLLVPSFYTFHGCTQLYFSLISSSLISFNLWLEPVIAFVHLTNFHVYLVFLRAHLCIHCEPRLMYPYTDLV